MTEFIRLCIAPFNLPMTVLLLCTMGYWTMFLLGAVGLDLFDADVDLDVGADADLELSAEGVDVDTELELDAEANVDSPTQVSSHGGLWIAILRFFNVGDVPIVVLVSGFAGSLWALTILTSHWFNPELIAWRSALWFVSNATISLLLTKAVTSPFRLLFQHANLGIEKPTRFVGRTCVVTTSNVTTHFGQARIDPPDGSAPIMLNVRLRDDSHDPVPKGAEALILEHDPRTNTFSVVPFDLGE